MGLADQLVAPELALVPGDKLAACHDLDAMCADADRDHFADPFGRNTVAIAVYRYEASAGDAQGQFDIGIKRHTDRLQHQPFQREDLGDRGILSGVATRAQFPAAGGKPGIQRRKVCKAWRGRKQPFTHIADLVLDLAPRHWA